MKKFLLVILAFTLPSAHAGEQIRLKSGTLHTQGMRLEESTMGDRLPETGLYIVQWKSAVTEAEKSELRDLGGAIISYIPDDAFLVRASRELAARFENLAFVRAVVPFHAGFKVESELTQNGVFGFGQEAVVMVQTIGSAEPEALQAVAPELKQLNKNLYAGNVRIGDVWKLAKLPEVLWIERYLPVEAMDMKLLDANFSASDAPAPYTGYESGTKILNVDAAYNAGYRGEGQLVAYADTGLDKGDLATLIPDFVGQVKSAWVVGLGGKSWGDPQNHGTHVAGSIAGSGASSSGRIRGSAYKARLVVEGMWSDILKNIAIPGVLPLFNRANSEGARIHSNSWGAPKSLGRYDTFAVQADTFHFENPDFLAVFASGNDGSDKNKDGVIDEGSVSSPGTAKNVLTVGASENLLREGGIQKKLIDLRPGKENWNTEPLASSYLSDNADGIAAFSSRGPTADGRLKPEVVAPGTNIVSARNTFPGTNPEDSWGIYDANYLYMGGTSMSTPIVSGAMALIRQYLVKRLGTEQVSSALMKAAVANTADDLFPGQFGQRAQGQEQPTRRPNNHEGWGRVNLASALDTGTRLFDERTGLATGQEKSFDLSLARRTQAGKALRITLAYTDAPGTAAAAKALVNDLDLVVVDPQGRTLFPNGKNAKDSTNNMEQIDVLQPVAGTYKITVRAASVPQGKNGAQPYALVISGVN